MTEAELASFVQSMETWRTALNGLLRTPQMQAIPIVQDAVALLGEGVQEVAQLAVALAGEDKR